MDKINKIEKKRSGMVSLEECHKISGQARYGIKPQKEEENEDSQMIRKIKKPGV